MQKGPRKMTIRDGMIYVYTGGCNPKCGGEHNDACRSHAVDHGGRGWTRQIEGDAAEAARSWSDTAPIDFFDNFAMGDPCDGGIIHCATEHYDVDVWAEEVDSDGKAQWVLLASATAGGQDATK